MFNMRWSQLRIQVNNLPDNVYAEASGNIIFFSREFLNDVKNGVISKPYFFFVFLHELAHVAQQAFLSLEMTKDKLKVFIERERVGLEKEADRVAFIFLATGLWLPLVMKFESSKKIDLCSCQNGIAQYWIVNWEASRDHFTEYGKDKDKISHRKEEFEKRAKEMNEPESSLVKSWMDLQSSATMKGAHELFSVTAYRELLNELKKGEVYDVKRACNEMEKESVKNELNEKENLLKECHSVKWDMQNKFEKNKSDQEDIIKKYPEKAQQLIVDYVNEVFLAEETDAESFERLKSQVEEVQKELNQECNVVSELSEDCRNLILLLDESAVICKELQLDEEKIIELNKEIDDLKQNIVHRKIVVKHGAKGDVDGFRTLKLESNICVKEICSGIEREIDLKSLIRGSSFNDRWLHDNVRFGLDYTFHTDRYLSASHRGSMQFLHSMECSDGSKKQNVEKILVWASFCIDVYNNVEIEIKGERKHLLDDGVSVKVCFEYYSKQNSLFKDMVSGLMDSTNTYKGNNVSYFFGRKSYDPKSSAIGSVAHMIQDSFAASHSKRCFDPFTMQRNDMSFEKCSEIYAPIYQGKKESFEGQKKFRDYLKKKAMPLLLFADYNNQVADKHAHADIFVNRVNADGVSFSIPDEQKDKEIDDDKLINEWLRVTSNASIARDCTEAFLYMVLMGYSKKEILEYIKSLFTYKQSLPITNSGLQFCKYEVSDSELKEKWANYNSFTEHLLCYNVKEPFVNRVEVFSLAITLLDKMIDSAQNADDRVQLWLHVNEIIVETDATTSVMYDDLFECASKKTQTEEMLFKRNICLETCFYIQNLLKKINGVVSKILLKTPNINLNEVEIRMLDVLEYINSESDCLKALVKNRPSELKKYLDKKKDSSAAVSVA